jgi:hypothetical protein
MSEIAEDENKRICRHYTYEHEYAGSSKVMGVACTSPPPLFYIPHVQTYNDDISVHYPPRLFLMDAPLFSADGDAKHVEEHSYRHQSCCVAAVIFYFLDNWSI